jgi:hypothetical protein
MAETNPYLDPVTGLPKTGTSAAWLGTQKQVDDSMATKVNEIASKDSALNQMARTEGLKAANRRGLLNSSMAIDASQDAVLKNALPIASQDASQAFQKNQAAKAFEYGMTAQEGQQAFQSGERQAGEGFQTGERLGTQGFQSTEAELARGWQTAENIAQRGFQGTEADLDRDLQRSMQTQQLDSAQSMQIKDIASREGIEAANRALSQVLQENDINFRMREGGLDREAALQQQKNDIAFQTSQNQATRDLQLKIANMNLGSTERQAASQFVTNMESMYQSNYQSIMNNTTLDAKTRNSLLTSAKNLRDNQLNFVEQMYNIDLKW